jgi:hypothetical protein
MSTIADVIDDELCSDPQDDCCVLMLRRNRSDVPPPQ